MKWMFWAIVLIVIVAFAVYRDMISLPAELSPIERQIDRAAEAVSTSVADNAPKVQATIDANVRSAANAVSNAVPVPATSVPSTKSTATLTTIPTPTVAFTPTPVPPDVFWHISEKRYMLKLINQERENAGVPPVDLGNNVAAQRHAESALANCFSSHWGIDGLKPYMRYSLAGDYQSNAENGSGSDYCIKMGEGYAQNKPAEEEIKQVMEGLMDSPGHRRNILNKWHKKVNIGLAWDRYNFSAYQHFEGDYIEYDRLPSIKDGRLSFNGRAKNGVRITDEESLRVQIYYDQPPHALTRGQVSRTYCYDSGRQVAAIRYPLTGRQYWEEDEFTKSYKPCPDPYDVPVDAPPARSHDQAHVLWQEAYDASRNQAEQTITVPWITASKWEARNGSFAVEVNIKEVIEEHGNGVYSVGLWGDIGGERTLISKYSIFHGVTPPDTYAPSNLPTLPTPTPTIAATSTPIPHNTPRVIVVPIRSYSPTATQTPIPTVVPTKIPAQTNLTTTVRPDIDTSQLEVRTHQLINAERVKHGLSPLDHIEKIRLIARSHSEDMAARGYVSHDSPDGHSPTDRGNKAGYDCRKDYGSYYTYGLAETIHQDWLYDSYRTLNGRIVSYEWFTLEGLAQTAVRGWMNSKGHRENILDSSYDRAGLGVAVADDGKVYFTQNFC